MNIGIDARPLQGETRFRGIGKATEFCLAAISQLPSAKKHSFIFYVDPGLERPTTLDSFNNALVKNVNSPKLGRRRFFRSFLSSFRAAKPAKRDIDVFLQFDAALGIPTAVPTIAVFYDLIPFLFRDQEKSDTKNVPPLRQQKNNLAGFLYWRKYLRFLSSYKNAAHILAISECSKKDYLKQFSATPADKISILPLGVDGSFFVSPRSKPSPKVQALAQSPYLLYVGGIDTRKNIVELIRVLYALKPKYPSLRLIVVGKEFELEDQLKDRGWFRELAKNKQYSTDVITAGFVSHDDLLHLYQQASCLVFPSLYEGFGLPVLEAMAASCPVVAYRTSSVPEVAGDACLLQELGEPLAEAVDRLLTDSSLQQKYREAGKKQAKKFTWDKTAQTLLYVTQRYDK